MTRNSLHVAYISHEMVIAILHHRRAAHLSNCLHFGRNKKLFPKSGDAKEPRHNGYYIICQLSNEEGERFGRSRVLSQAKLVLYVLSFIS